MAAECERLETEYVAVSPEAYGRGFTDAQALAAWAGSITEETAAEIDATEVTIHKVRDWERVTPDGLEADDADRVESWDVEVDGGRLDTLRGTMRKADTLARMLIDGAE